MRRVVVIALLAAWLAPGAAAAVAADAACCCPEEMQGACIRDTGCALRDCHPDDGAALTSAKGALRSTPELPAPLEAGPAAALPRTLTPETVPDPFHPPPRG